MDSSDIGQKDPWEKGGNQIYVPSNYLKENQVCNPEESSGENSTAVTILFEKFVTHTQMDDRLEGLAEKLANRLTQTISPLQLDLQSLRRDVVAFGEAHKEYRNAKRWAITTFIALVALLAAVAIGYGNICAKLFDSARKNPISSTERQIAPANDTFNNTIVPFPFTPSPPTGALRDANADTSNAMPASANSGTPSTNLPGPTK